LVKDLKHPVLDKKIVIEMLVDSENELGDSIKSWVFYKNMWAAVTNLHGNEKFIAAQTQAEKTVKFKIRFTEMDETMRILFRGVYFDITSLDNIKYGDQFIEVSALAVV